MYRWGAAAILQWSWCDPAVSNQRSTRNNQHSEKGVGVLSQCRASEEFRRTDKIFAGANRWGWLRSFQACCDGRNQEKPSLALSSIPSRKDHLAALRKIEECDVLVIGGGATGAGIALDAASRGLQTVLIEREDFGSATSSRSTKLLHGGVRYLEKAVLGLDYQELALVLSALRERYLVIQSAPHLCEPLALLTPFYNWMDIPYVYVGLKMYDLLAGSKALRQSYLLSASQAKEKFPALKTNGLWGAVVYYDGQMDDARLNLAVVQTAACYGAVVLNYAELERLAIDEETGLATGGVVKDKLSGKQWNIKAKTVINATGPFCDSIRYQEALDTTSFQELVAPSLGAHLVLGNWATGYGSTESFSFLSKSKGEEPVGLLVPKTSDGRVLFLLPWEGHTLVGTTDRPLYKSAEHNSSPGNHTRHPYCLKEEAEYMINTVKDYLEICPSTEDVLSAWSGIRPLVRDLSHKEMETRQLSRDHVLLVGQREVITVSGGKWTTYRQMAEEAVEKAIELKGLKASGSRTSQMSLWGSEGYFSTQKERLFDRLKKRFDSFGSEDLIQATSYRLSNTYGGHADSVLDIAEEEKLGNPWLIPDLSYPILKAEVLYCIRYEYAQTIEDFVARRSRLAFVNEELARQHLDQIANLFAKELKWSRWKTRRQIQQALKILDSFRVVDGKAQDEFAF